MAYIYGRPALCWLINNDAVAGLAVRDYINANDNAPPGPVSEGQPSQFDPRDLGSEDAETHSIPDEPLTSETMSETAVDGPDEVCPERLHEEQPSERDLLRSIGWLEWPVTGLSDPLGWAMRAPGGRVLLAEGAVTPVEFQGRCAKIGGLTYYLKPEARREMPGGMLVSYRDAAGTERGPSFKTVKPKGGKSTGSKKGKLLPTDPNRHLALTPAAAPMDAAPHQRPISDAPALMPMLTPLQRSNPRRNHRDEIIDHGRYGVAEARAELDWHYANDNLPPITKCPPAIAKGARFMGGVIVRNKTAAKGVTGKKESVAPINAATAAVLEVVASRGTLADIGEAVRDKSKPAPVRLDRLGGPALLAAGRALVAANDIMPAKKIAA